MMKLKEKMHEYLQKKALDKAIYNLIGDYGYWSIYKDDKKLVFRFNEEKINKLEKIEFNLPCIEEIVDEAKKIYINFDASNIKKIEYNFLWAGFRNFCFNKVYPPKDLILYANRSDINISRFCLNNIEINNANDVYVDGTCVESLNNIKIKSKTINLANIINFMNQLNDVILESEEINLKILSIYAKNILFKASNINFNNNFNLDARNIVINSKIIKSRKVYCNQENKICAEKIILDSDYIDLKDTLLKGEEVTIQSKNCNQIQSVDSPKIIYNGKDISNNDEIVIQKLRRKFLQKLQGLNHKTNIKIVNMVNEEVDEYKKKLEFYKENSNDSLNDKPVTKILKK